ncbi:hypothetical protein PAPYR_6779 [Paratrimastix pyriformis]|uniref:EamA domain-containing protein n=1 Tax=Paratrimastix pyriformis TaxID=342808 RepID=A0ABQ8UEE0_9EUKA|nr:hypothetical protein PAPYR_6779 [Paratrimastix pyriformis]
MAITCGGKYGWIFYSLTVSVLWAIALELMGVGSRLSSQTGILSSLSFQSYLALSYVIVLVFAIPYFRRQTLVEKRRPHKPSPTRVCVLVTLFTGKGMTFPRQLLGAIVAGTLNCLGNYLLNAAFNLDPASAGTTSTLLAISTLCVTVFAAIFLRENLNISRWMGVLICVAGVVMLPLDGAGGASFVVVLGAVSSLFYGSCNYILKVLGSCGANSMWVMVIVWAVPVPVGSIFLIVLYAIGDIPTMTMGPTVWPYLCAMGGALGLGVGLLFLNVGFTVGPGGPVAALVLLDSVYMIIFEAGAFGSIPGPLKLAGAVCLLVGAIVLIMGGEQDRVLRWCGCAKAAPSDPAKVRASPAPVEPDGGLGAAEEGEGGRRSTAPLVSSPSAEAAASPAAATPPPSPSPPRVGSPSETTGLLVAKSPASATLRLPDSETGGDDSLPTTDAPTEAATPIPLAVEALGAEVAPAPVAAHGGDDVADSPLGEACSSSAPLGDACSRSLAEVAPVAATGEPAATVPTGSLSEPALNPIHPGEAPPVGQPEPAAQP